MSTTASAAMDKASASRWTGRPAYAIALRTVVYLAPLVGSIVFVHFASQVVPAPTGSLVLFLVWWLGLSALATGVLVVVDRVFRKLLPLAALLKLSLVFPDEAPSRFKVALRSGSVEDLAGRIAATKSAAEAATPSEAAARLLELVAALNIHDRLTRGHCERVRAYSVMIGEELGLSSAELDLLNWAALLHDVGKLEVPGEILAKDGRPTDDEWEVLRRHPLLGDRPRRADARVAREMDGRGRIPPRTMGRAGLPARARRRGDPARRPDRRRRGRLRRDHVGALLQGGIAAEAGRTEIANCAGSQFDPHVVRAFLAVSLGRMRFVMGPLSWLAHAPLLGRLPLTPGFGTLAGALSVAATSAVGGLVAPPAAPAVVKEPPVARVSRPAGRAHTTHHLARHDIAVVRGVPNGSPPVVAPTAPPHPSRAGHARRPTTPVAPVSPPIRRLLRAPPPQPTTTRRFTRTARFASTSSRTTQAQRRSRCVRSEPQHTATQRSRAPRPLPGAGELPRQRLVPVSARRRKRRDRHGDGRRQCPGRQPRTVIRGRRRCDDARGLRPDQRPLGRGDRRRRSAPEGSLRHVLRRLRSVHDATGDQPGRDVARRART